MSLLYEIFIFKFYLMYVFCISFVFFVQGVLCLCLLTISLRNYSINFSELKEKERKNRKQKKKDYYGHLYMFIHESSLPLLMANLNATYITFITKTKTLICMIKEMKTGRFF